MTLQQVIDERISFLKEQINHKQEQARSEQNSSISNRRYQYVDDDIEKVEFIILRKKSQLKNCKDLHDPIDCLQRDFNAWNGCRVNSKILLNKKKKNTKQQYIVYDAVAVYEARNQFARTSENPLICQQCIIINADPWERSQMYQCLVKHNGCQHQ